MWADVAQIAANLENLLGDVISAHPELVTCSVYGPRLQFQGSSDVGAEELRKVVLVISGEK